MVARHVIYCFQYLTFSNEIFIFDFFLYKPNSSDGFLHICLIRKCLFAGLQGLAGVAQDGNLRSAVDNACEWGDPGF